jgi:anti-anti-sigma factor
MFNGAGYAVVEVDGCLDQSASMAFSTFLCAAAEGCVARGETLRIDLSGLTQISSHGLRALASAHKRVAAARVTLACPEGSLREILTISRLDEVYPIEAA